MSRHFTNPHTDDYGKPKAAHKQSYREEVYPDDLNTDHYWLKPLLLKSTTHVEKRRDIRTGKQFDVGTPQGCDVGYQIWDCQLATVKGREVSMPVRVYHDNLKLMFRQFMGETLLVSADLHEDGLSVAGVWDASERCWEQGDLC